MAVGTAESGVPAADAAGAAGDPDVRQCPRRPRYPVGYGPFRSGLGGGRPRPGPVDRGGRGRGLRVPGGHRAADQCRQDAVGPPDRGLWGVAGRWAPLGGGDAGLPGGGGHRSGPEHPGQRAAPRTAARHRSRAAHRGALGTEGHRADRGRHPRPRTGGGAAGRGRGGSPPGGAGAVPAVPGHLGDRGSTGQGRPDPGGPVLLVVDRRRGGLLLPGPGHPRPGGPDPLPPGPGGHPAAPGPTGGR